MNALVRVVAMLVLVGLSAAIFHEGATFMGVVFFAGWIFVCGMWFAWEVRPFQYVRRK